MGLLRSAARLVAASVVALGLFGGSAAGAVETPVFDFVPGDQPVAFGTDYSTTLGARWPMSVSGTFRPLPMRCGVEVRILWYAPGAAADSLWRNIARPATGEVTKTVVPLSVSGTFEPRVGDFDGDGCDDVLWYAAGTAADAVWYFAPDGSHAAFPLTVNGTYVPVVGDFDAVAATDEVFWYGPSTNPESIWTASRASGPFTTVVRGRFRPNSAPQVSGVFEPVLFSDRTGIYWNSPTGSDAIWRDLRAGSTTVTGTTVSVAHPGAVSSVAGMPMLWTPGSAPQTGQLMGSTPSAAFATLNGFLPAATVVGGSTPRTEYAVLHQPGPGTDWLLLPRTRPVPTAVAVGGGGTVGASCVVVGSSGSVQCWGNNYGNAGADRAVPRKTSFSGVSVAVQDDFGCSTTSAGQVYCWGSNSYGRLGRPTTSVTGNQVGVVTGIVGATEVGVGNEFACALASGQVRCWGRNNFGQLGHGAPLVPASTAPVLVSGIAGASDLSVGLEHACAVVADREVRCWGKGTSGQLGNGASTNRSAPVVVTGIANARLVAAGLTHTCASRADGTLACWGDDANGRLGNGSVLGSSNVPTVVQGLTGPVGSLSAGKVHTCAVTSGELWCWGSNFNGTLGTGDVGIGSTTGDHQPPTRLAGAGYVTVAAGEDHSCVTATNGRMRCWGKGAALQLGPLFDGPVNRTVPTNLTWWGD